MPTLDNFILDKFKEVYADDLQFQRACKKADYELRNGYIIDMFANVEDAIVFIPYTNNRLKSEHKPMRRMRHYGRRQNYAR